MASKRGSVKRAATWKLEEDHARQFVEMLRAPTATKTDVLQQLSEALTIPEETLRKKIRRGLVRLRTIAEGGDANWYSSRARPKVDSKRAATWKLEEDYARVSFISFHVQL